MSVVHLRCADRGFAPHTLGKFPDLIWINVPSSTHDQTMKKKSGIADGCYSNDNFCQRLAWRRVSQPLLARSMFLLGQSWKMLWEVPLEKQ